MKFQQIFIRVFLGIGCWLCFSNVFTQEDSLRTTNIPPPYSCLYSRNYTSPRAGVSYQNRWATELDISFQKRNFSCTGFYARTYYTSLEWLPSFQNTEQNKSLYALKTGVEINPMGLVLGIEAKYQTDFSKSNILFVPRIGIGVFGDVVLLYGYQISLFKQPFNNFSTHQFSLVLNLKRNFLTLH